MDVYSISPRSWDARTSLRLVPVVLKIESDILYLLGGMMFRSDLYTKTWETCVSITQNKHSK